MERGDAPDWRRADEPVAAHRIAEGLLPAPVYARARGVAQQAARAARAARLDRDRRARLLCAAWLHTLVAVPGAPDPAAALDEAGHPCLARLVAHAGGAAPQWPPPEGADAGLLTLLDAAVVTTSPEGAACTPAALVRAAGDEPRDGVPSRRAVVAAVARLADDPAGRAVAEHLAPRTTAAS